MAFFQTSQTSNLTKENNSENKERQDLVGQLEGKQVQKPGPRLISVPKVVASPYEEDQHYEHCLHEAAQEDYLATHTDPGFGSVIHAFDESNREDNVVNTQDKHRQTRQAIPHIVEHIVFVYFIV